MSFNRTIPESLKAYKDIIINSMKRPKKILESLLKVKFFLDNFYVPYEIFQKWEINEYDESLIIKYTADIGSGKTEERIRFNIDENNHYIIIFKFTDDILIEDDIASAEIYYGTDRPLIGIITFKNEIPISKLNEKYLEPLMLHLFTHLLGFQDNDENILDIIEEDTSLSKYFVASEKVIEYAKKYFGDESIDKIEILKDEKGNLHWPSRILLGDYMTKFNYPEELSISGFTLAFLEDLGYYEIENYYTGGLMRFGKNKGSDFLNKKCEKDGVQFKNEFYYPTSDLTIIDQSCSSGRQSKTKYKLISYTNGDGTTSSIPVDYQYFNEDVTMGGFESADYCPISQSYSEIKLNDLCSETTNTANNIIGESFSSNSFCALTSLIKKSTPNYETYLNKVQSGCFEMFCSKLSLTIKIGEEYFVCPRSGGKINGNEDFEGYFLCPDYNLICTGEYMCNNMFDCVEKKSKENEESFKYDGENGYTIKTTQISSEYTDINLSPIIRAWELSEDNDGKCPYFCSQCNLNGECTRCGTNYKIVNNICEEKVENCEEYNSNEECQTCKTNYVFVDGNKNNCLEKSELDSQKYIFKILMIPKIILHVPLLFKIVKNALIQLIVQNVKQILE